MPMRHFPYKAHLMCQYLLRLPMALAMLIGSLTRAATRQAIRHHYEDTRLFPLGYWGVRDVNTAYLLKEGPAGRLCMGMSPSSACGRIEEAAVTCQHKGWPKSSRARAIHRSQYLIASKYEALEEPFGRGPGLLQV